jgi:hypothetical protein
VEAALAVMRLSCEKFPVLLSLYVAHLLFWEPPPWAAALVAFNGRLSSAWQRVVLLSFPAVCWVYGAGVVFSTFVSGEHRGVGVMCAGVLLHARRACHGMLEHKQLAMCRVGGYGQLQPDCSAWCLPEHSRNTATTPRQAYHHL